jgi:hypothetical protein
MHIPFVIDNISNQLADILNNLLQEQAGQVMDVATAYFSIRAFDLLRHTLPTVGSFRLLLGDEPQSSEDIGLRPNARAFLRKELNAEPLKEDTQRLVEEIVRFLRRDDIQVRLYLGHNPEEDGRRRFLHAKCYLFYEDRFTG